MSDLFNKSGDMNAYNKKGELVPSSLGGVIESGYPSMVINVIEAFCERIDEQVKCEKELNSLFEIHNSPWRVVNATVVLIDSDYLHNEVIAKTQNLLRENSVPGALEEMTKASSYLTEGNTKDAVVYAHKSVESVMKTCLETKKHLTFGKLLEKLIKSEFIPINLHGKDSRMNSFSSATACLMISSTNLWVGLFLI